MIRPRRPLVRSVLTATSLAAVVALAGCSQEEPLEPVETPAPSEDTGAGTADATEAPDDAAATSAGPDEAAATSAGPDDAAATSAAPEAEVLAAADGSYEIDLPEGWEDAMDLVPEASAEDAGELIMAVRETERKDDYYSNILVIKDDYVGNLTSAVEDSAEEMAGEDGEYEILEAAPVDGNRAPGYTLVREIDGTELHQTQRWISNDGTLYVVTLTAVPDQTEDAGAALDGILESWNWTKD